MMYGQCMKDLLVHFQQQAGFGRYILNKRLDILLQFVNLLLVNICNSPIARLKNSNFLVNP